LRREGSPLLIHSCQSLRMIGIAGKASTYDAHGAAKGRPDVIIHTFHKVVVGLPRLASISQYLDDKQYH
jgi:hypothetical protein